MQMNSKGTTLAGHGAGAIAEAFLIAMIIALLALALSPVLRPAASIAGVHTTSAASTSWIALKSSAALASSRPSLGSTVGFDAGYPKTVKNPRVAVKCYQDGSLVYAEAGSVADSFVLGGASSDWVRSGGAANCQADLFYFTYKGKVQTYHWLASTDFAAAG
jgi:hypothetical protein